MQHWHLGKYLSIALDKWRDTYPTFAALKDMVQWSFSPTLSSNLSLQLGCGDSCVHGDDNPLPSQQIGIVQS